MFFFYAICSLGALANPLPPRTIDIEPHRAKVDWTTAGAEAVQILSDYIQVNTVNPPGNETLGAEFLGSILTKEEIAFEISEIEPGRSNLVARLNATIETDEKPLCLLHHMDVVTVESDKWTPGIEPLSGKVDDTYIWGRGALDMKGMGVMELMTLIHLKRTNVPLRRDVILLAVADEEVMGLGIQHLIENNWPDLECGHVINEGGLGLKDMLFPGQTVYPISVGEKGNVWLKMWTSGDAGHGSTPRPNEAPRKMLAALNALENREIQVVIGPEMTQLLSNMGTAQGGFTGFVMNRRRLRNWLVKPKLMENPLTRAAIINTVHFTGASGANQPNVVPSEVYAQLDCRIQPGVNPEEFILELQEIVGPDVRFEVLAARPGNRSPMNDPVYHALARAAVEGEPNAVAGPVISVGFTDSIYVRPLGTRAYGFMPVALTAEEMKGFHGADERLSIENMEKGLYKLYSAVLEVVAQ